VERLVLLETNIDDATAQVMAYCSERLLQAGALDVWAQPIQMKKQRNGFLLSVLCRPAEADAMEAIIFRETPTFGIRRKIVERRSLARRFENLETRFGVIRMKVVVFEGDEKATPEFEDCRAAALKFAVPFREVIAEANAAWRGESQDPGRAKAAHLK
jgi:pyridinium-3,5-bisthiocarboxylic acid mononucleotide nickel chelatase